MQTVAVLEKGVGGGGQIEAGGEKRGNPCLFHKALLYQKVAQKPGANVCSPASPGPLTEALANSLICIAHIKENKRGGGRRGWEKNSQTHTHPRAQKRIITFHLINIKTAISEHAQASKEK